MQARERSSPPVAAVVSEHAGERSLFGRTPNVAWRSLSLDALRRHPRFVALPPVEDLCVAGPASLAFVRQDSPLWRDLHDGRVTGSNVLSACGAREKHAVAKLGLPHAAGGRRHAASAAATLRAAPLHCEAPCAEAAAAAEAHNAAAASLFNATLLPAAPTSGDVEMADAPAAEPAAAGVAPATAVSPVVRRSRKSASRRRAALAAASLAAGAPAHRRPPPAAAASPAVAAAAPRSPFDVAMERVSFAAAGSGASAVRCAWGSAQESGTLFSLLAAFPSATLLEVGLFSGCRRSEGPLPPPLPLPPPTPHLPPLLPHEGSHAAAIVQLGLSAWSPRDAALALGLSTEDANSVPHFGASPDALVAWPPCCPSAPGGGVHNYTIFEVVEVKNVCPFFQQGDGKYALSDRGPPGALPPKHVAQIQLQCVLVIIFCSHFSPNFYYPLPLSLTPPPPLPHTGCSPRARPPRWWRSSRPRRGWPCSACRATTPSVPTRCACWRASQPPSGPALCPAPCRRARLWIFSPTTAAPAPRTRHGCAAAPSSPRPRRWSITSRSPCGRRGGGDRFCDGRMKSQKNVHLWRDEKK